MPFVPGIFLSRVAALTTEEIGVLATAMALVWQSGRPMLDAPERDRVTANAMGCSTHRWRRIRKQLIATGHFEVRPAGLWVPLIDLFIASFKREPVSRRLKQFIFDRDGEQCAYCGSSEGPFQIDHVIPVALGGSSAPHNLAVACRPCNLSKGPKPMQEWLQ